MAQDDGYVVIFRMSFRNRWTGQIIRSKDGKPFPIKIRVPKP